MVKQEFPKAYEPNQYEDAIYAAWEKSGFFNPDHLPGVRREAFSMVLPPPNVTGTLHMGHAVMLALEDIMTRFARMRGKRALWIPGTDHAAIATQAKVEKLLREKGIKDPRRELGREKFLAEVEKFAAQSHDIIVNQSKKMGASLDWSREAYTLDAERNLAVNKAFKMMYDDGLIYRGHRVVNWCPHCQSTIADDEVEYREEKGKFYYFKYGPVVIGTARPETKFGDKTIVVHPDDMRYRDLVGKEMDVEWIDGKLRANVIADAMVDKEFGTGAMTITPAHSFEDFTLAQKHNLPIVQIIDEKGAFMEAAGAFRGKNVRESRDAIVEILRKKGLVDHIDENYVHNLSVCYRCGTPIEPLPKMQWFINVNKPFAFRASKHAPIKGLQNNQLVSLKQVMQYVVREKEITIIPDRFEKTYFNWIDNLRDWNISRQIWFGHRVPVWYRGEAIHVGHAPTGEDWEQDPDTLDTWFSSGLWTISTLGWPFDAQGRPEKTKDFKFFHPTSVLETGYDILFFWVARMILMTTYAVGEVPFRQVYLHGLVRDEKGRKMSKSLGNVIDPLDMIKKYGADATRLSLVIGSTPGNDAKLSEEKVAGYRNFTNKLWNIARFVLSTVVPPHSPPLKPATLADRWILGRFAEVTHRVTKHLEAHEFSAAGELLRDFTWSEFADWYLEIAKIQRREKKQVGSTDRILLFILERLLALWHPFMPFVTEEIWLSFPLLTKEGQGEVADRMLMVHSWPKALKSTDERAQKDFRLVQDVIIAIRNIRAEHKVTASAHIHAGIGVGSHRALFEKNAELIATLARLSDLGFDGPLKDAGIPIVSVQLGDVSVFVETPGTTADPEKERTRLQEELEESKKYLAGRLNQLNNKEFLAKAPPHVVETLKKNKDEAEKKVAEIEKQLKTL